MTMAPEKTPPVVATLCKERGWPFARLAKALGVSRARIYQIMEETQCPDAGTVAKLAAILNVKESALVDEKGRWHYTGS